jgi:hypothetical protein
VAIRNFWQQVLQRVRELPGIESAAVATNTPMTDNHDRSDITIEGMAQPSRGNYPHPDGHVVSPGYVRTLGQATLRFVIELATDRQDPYPWIAAEYKRIKSASMQSDKVVAARRENDYAPRRSIARTSAGWPEARSQKFLLGTFGLPADVVNEMIKDAIRQHRVSARGLSE